MINIFSWILKVLSVDFHRRIWDLSLEKDEEEEAEFKAKTKEQVNAPEDLPPQLLFIHQVDSNISLYVIFIVKFSDYLVSPIFFLQ